MLEGIDKSYYEAIVKSEELWEWMCDNPTKDKSEFPNYKKYKLGEMDGDCTLCDYHRPYNDSVCILKCAIQTTCHKWIPIMYDFTEEEHKAREAIYFNLLEERLRIM